MSQPTPPGQPRNEPTGRQVYNIVTDTVTGANIRLWDNVFQAVAVGTCLLLGIPIGWLVARNIGGDPIAGAVLGGFLGLLVGLFGSGIFLMIFRAYRHVRGKHD